MNTKPLVIGVAGGSGSGKTTLAKNLNLAIPNSIILSHDFYYKDWERCRAWRSGSAI